MNVGRMAFKMFKTNSFTLEEVCKYLNVDEKTLMAEFKKYCGDAYVFPGIFMIGSRVDDVVDAIEKIGKVVVRGPSGCGKTITAFAALNKIGDYKRVYSITELDRLITLGYKGIVFIDDIDCLDKKELAPLLEALGSTRIVCTATDKVSYPGFHAVDLKPLSVKEIDLVAKSKGWVVPKGASSLKEISKINSQGGVTVARKESETLLGRTRKLISGQGIHDITKPELEQAFRNSYEVNPATTMESMGAFVGAWISFFSGVDPSAAISTIKPARGAAAVAYRKKVI